MSESTLHATYTSLRAEAAFYLGFGDDSSAWTSTGVNSQTTLLDRVMTVGLRRGYFPPPITMPDGLTINSYRWTWMRPGSIRTLWSTKAPAAGITAVITGDAVAGTGGTFYATMLGKGIDFYTNDTAETLVGSGVVATVPSSTSLTLRTAHGIAPATTYRWGMAADGGYRLPDEFGSLDGPIFFRDDGGDREISLTSINRIRQYRQGDIARVGMPFECAVIPVDHLLDNPFAGSPIGQRFDLEVNPIPDQDYEVVFTYTYLPTFLTSALVYHAGGMPYSEMFRCSILAACESEIRDERGLRHQLWLEALLGAVNYDLSLKPHTLGRNTDTGLYDEGRMRLSRREIITTYNGLY